MRVADPTCWGLFREREHSPGRESDDAEILRLTGKHLESRGFQVDLRAPEDLAAAETPPDGVFFMCERMEALRILLAWPARGVRLVNSPQAVLNTYRERMVAQLREANVAFVSSRLVAPRDPPEALAGALAGLAARGIEGAVLQPHVPGDLIKFYGIGPGGGADGGPPWFRWFYHKDQRLAGHPFDALALARLVRAAAGALGLEVYGGDAIAGAEGSLQLIDLNAWPSFALYRDEAAPVIASYLALRFGPPRASGGGR
jgi:hypothetical protein